MRVVVITAILAFMVAGASLAYAEEVTRDSYKAQVEPICKTDTEANEKVLQGVRTEVKQGKLKPAGARFMKAAQALNKAYLQLKAVPQPPADEAKLAKWLSYIKTEVSLFEQAGKALKAGNEHKAQTYVAKLTHNANLANSQVISFGFRYCKLQPSKFT